MGKTYRHYANTKFDDERKQGRSGKRASHASGRKSGGMKIVNNIISDEDDDLFDDDVEITDEIELNMMSEKDS